VLVKSLKLICICMPCPMFCVFQFNRISVSCSCPYLGFTVYCSTKTFKIQ